MTVASNGDANQSLHLIHRRLNMMTAVCGTVSASALGLAFFFGAKHGYLIYASVTSAILLRNQQQTLREIGEWLKDRYYFAKELFLEYHARKLSQENSRPVSKPTKHMAKTISRDPLLPPQQVTSALEKLGAKSLTNCLVSGIAFGIAMIGVLGDRNWGDVGIVMLVHLPSQKIAATVYGLQTRRNCQMRIDPQ